LSVTVNNHCQHCRKSIRSSRADAKFCSPKCKQASYRRRRHRTSGERWTLEVGDCAKIPLADDSVDLVFCSPPYESQRCYGIDFDKRGEDWVEWAVECFQECLRVSRGLVCWVCEGSTKNYRYSATPFLLMADLHRAGVCLRKPAVFQRWGMAGSGGPDWLRNCWEPIVCATSKRGKLPWSDNTAMGSEPKYKHTYKRRNRTRSGELQVGDEFQIPERCNPGNVIQVAATGGTLGSKLAHENEAPFPEDLATFFIKSFCPPSGTVLDPFCGSGGTLAAALDSGRMAHGIDIRPSQVELSAKRLADVP